MDERCSLPGDDHSILINGNAMITPKDLLNQSNENFQNANLYDRGVAPTYPPSAFFSLCHTPAA
jgi:hypothetical protein